MSELQWYYRSGGKPHGPVSGSELKRMAVSGELRPTDTVRGVGMSAWLPAGDFEGLFPASAPTSNPVDSGQRSSLPVPPVLPQPAGSPPPGVSQPVSPPVHRPVPPPVPPVLTSAPPAQDPSSFGFVDPGNPYATFGLDPSPQSSPASGAADYSYNPMATLNQQDILAMEAVQAAEAAKATADRATGKRNSYAPSYSAASKQGSSNLQAIASCRLWMNVMFILSVFSQVFFYGLIMWCVAVSHETGAELSDRGTAAIVVVYFASFVPWIGMFYYVCRLARLLGKSVVLYFLMCLFLTIIAIILLGIEASRRLNGRRY